MSTTTMFSTDSPLFWMFVGMACTLAVASLFGLWYFFSTKKIRKIKKTKDVLPTHVRSSRRSNHLSEGSPIFHESVKSHPHYGTASSVKRSSSKRATAISPKFFCDSRDSRDSGKLSKIISEISKKHSRANQLENSASPTGLNRHSENILRRGRVTTGSLESTSSKRKSPLSTVRASFGSARGRSDSPTLHRVSKGSNPGSPGLMTRSTTNGAPKSPALNNVPKRASPPPQQRKHPLPTSSAQDTIAAFNDAV